MGELRQTMLRRPNRKGFMAPFTILELVQALEGIMGTERRDEALRAARVYRLPEADEPVREDKVARLHQTVRQLWPEEAPVITARAGQAVAIDLLTRQISKKAQTMLSGMPRATGAWLLAKTVHQNAWTFCGSGTLVIESDTRFVLKDNPIVAGETSDLPVCQFHASLFEHLYASLIHPRLTCREVACRTKGDPACVFEFTFDKAASQD